MLPVPAEPGPGTRGPDGEGRDRLVYEAHVRGLTRLHPQVPEHQRGTFAALGHPSVVQHLRGLGVTTLELMPVLSFTTEPRLVELGLTNHWGYNPDDWTTLYAPYACTDDPERELTDAVGALHDAGIEVVLDVVLNHTAPGALPAHLYRAVDVTGCGNTVDAARPEVIDRALDCLTHWRRRLGVDGFRFDLAGALARDEQGRPDLPGDLLTRIADDDTLGDLLLLVEPWDATAEGYSLGRYGDPFVEWNDRFRDDVRDFWRGSARGVRDLATRLAGSSDLVDSPDRVLNFVTAHDGFTLRDLVSYARKHNELNGEDGADGHDDNRSDNLGVEGDSRDPDVEARRQARARALLTTLLLSRGTPMLRMGDEWGHTQLGNNNAYCHDSPLTWVAWDAEPGWDLREHVAAIMIDRRGWVGPDHLDPDEVEWLAAPGRPMTAEAWADDGLTRLGMRIGSRTLWCDTADQTAVMEREDAGGLPPDRSPWETDSPRVALMAVTRVPVLDVRPRVESGRFPVKAVVGEDFVVRARVFGEGSAVVGAAVVLTGPDGEVRSRHTMVHEDNDHWTATVRADEVGPWSFSIESWHDPIATWQRDARLKIAAGVDVEVTLAEGSALLDRVRLRDDTVTDPSVPPLDRLDHAVALFENAEVGGARLHDHLDATEPHHVFVDRERALHGAWYEMFPRSEGATEDEDGGITPGTFTTAAKRLEAVAAMGFDVVYLPPIHPIGTRSRKGRNNSLTALPGDPGSPWAVGSRDGGHDAVNPELGTLADFDAFVARAHELGLEVALDLALQCSPDHPWVRDHPEWFVTRVDGTIAFAENPPKQYQDIYPLTFDEDPQGLYVEVRRVIEHWIDHGVRIFRVDNPHTKPVGFWEQLLEDLRESHPDVVLLAEAFTVPAMLHALAMVGFHQSYTYFTWREQPAEIAAYLHEVSHESSDFMRPNFWVNTPDILPTYLQSGDPAMFKMRAALAATASPSWGMYAGYELLERQAMARSEEYASSEKYEIKVRDWDDPRSIAPYVTRLNEVRRAHPALHRLRNLQLVSTGHHRVVAFTKVQGDDVVLVVVDARPWFTDTVTVHLDPTSLGLPADVTWHDEIEQIDCALDAVPIGPDHPVRVLVPRPSR